MKQEIELKYQISCLADFKRLLATLKKQARGPINKLHQRNIFFDTPGLDLRKNLISLRLRRENQIYYLCVKQSGLSSRVDNLSVRLEFERQVSKEIADLMLTEQISPIEVFAQLASENHDDLSTRDNLSVHLKNLALREVKIIGFFINKRTKIPIILNNHKIFIELDQTTYPDKIDIFEMEIEFHTQEEARVVQPAIENILEELGLVISASTPKSDRLYRILFG